MSAVKEVTRMRKAVEERGYVVVPGRGHWRILHPDTGKVIDTLASTPSDSRWWKNAVTRLKSKGILDVDPKKEGQMAATTERTADPRTAKVIARTQKTLTDLGYPDTRGVVPEFARHVMSTRIPAGHRTFKNLASAEECIRRIMKGETWSLSSWTATVLEYALDDLENVTSGKSDHTWMAPTPTTTTATGTTTITSSATTVKRSAGDPNGGATSADGRFRGLDPQRMKLLKQMYDEFVVGLEERKGKAPYGIWPKMADYIIAYNEAKRHPSPVGSEHPSKPMRNLLGARIADAYQGKPLRRVVREYIERGLDAYEDGWKPTTKTEPTPVMEKPTTTTTEPEWPQADERAPVDDWVQLSPMGGIDVITRSDAETPEPQNGVTVVTEAAMLMARGYNPDTDPHGVIWQQMMKTVGKLERMK